MILTLSVFGSITSETTNAVATPRVDAEWYVNFDDFGPNVTVEITALNKIAANDGTAAVTLRHSLFEGDAAGTPIVSLTPPSAGTGGLEQGNSGIVVIANPGGMRYVTVTSTAATTGPISVSYRGVIASIVGPDANGCGATVNTPLVALRMGAMVLADKVNDASVTPDTWDQWVNQGIESLWNKVTTCYGDQFFSQVDFVLAGGPTGNFYDVTTIPAKDFRKIRLVEVDPDTSNRRKVRSFNFSEKDQGAGGLYLGVWDSLRRHRLMGNKLLIERYENCAGNYRLYYVPKAPTLVAPCDTLPDSINQYAEYPMVFAAMKGLGVEESDESPLAARLADLLGEIEASAPSRDDADSDTIADVESQGNLGRGWT